MSGDMVERVAAFTEQERQWIIATPLQMPISAAIIAYHAGERAIGHGYAQFARRHLDLVQRLSGQNGEYAYRLSPLGQQARDTALHLQKEEK